MDQLKPVKSGSDRSKKPEQTCQNQYRLVKTSTDETKLVSIGQEKTRKKPVEIIKNH